MIVAVATDDNNVASHFGRCKEYTICTINDGKIIDTKKVPNPGHEPGFLPKYLHELGVNCLIAGGMGVRAQSLFDAKGIDIIVGVSGCVNDILNSYIVGKIKPGFYNNTCSHGEGEHSCEHD